MPQDHNVPKNPKFQECQQQKKNKRLKRNENQFPEPQDIYVLSKISTLES